MDFEELLFQAHFNDHNQFLKKFKSLQIKKAKALLKIDENIYLYVYENFSINID